MNLKLAELLESSIKLNTTEISVLRNELASQRLELEKIKVKVAVFASLASVAVNIGIAVLNHYK